MTSNDNAGPGASTTMPALQATRLRCEYLVDPLGIDVRTPRLSWQLEVAPRSAGSAGPAGSGGILSLNMKMFCSVAVFLYRYLAGIAPAGRGFRDLAIKPHLLGDLTAAGASVATVNGTVRSRWTRTEDVAGC